MIATRGHLALLASCCTLLFIGSLLVIASSRADLLDDLWKEYKQKLQSVMQQQSPIDLRGTLFQTVTEPTSARWTSDDAFYLSEDIAKYAPKWSDSWGFKSTSSDGELGNLYKKLLLALPDKSMGARAFTQFQTCPRLQGSALPWVEAMRGSSHTINAFRKNMAAVGGRRHLFDMVDGQKSKSFIREWFASDKNVRTFISRDAAYFDKYDLRFESRGVVGIPIAPGQWFDKNVLQAARRDGNLSRFIASNGEMPLMPATVWLAYQPTIIAKVTRTIYYQLKSDIVNKQSLAGVSIGGFFFANGNQNVMSDSEDEPMEGEIRFLGAEDEDEDEDQIASDSASGQQQVTFTSKSVATSQGTGALAWFCNDVDGDKRDDIIHLWNNGGRLNILYYTAASGFNAQNAQTGQGTGALAFFAGDVNGDKRADVVHLWNDRGRLNILWYNAASGFSASNVATGQGAGAIAFLKGDFDGDGRMDIAHLWNNGGRLNIIVYYGGRNFAAQGFGTDQGTGSLGWFVGDVDGDKRDDIIHLWNCSGKLCIMWYTAATGFRAHNVRTDQGTGAIRFMVGDWDGDGRTDIGHLWNCGNRLCILTYTAASGFSASNVNTGQGTGAVAWLTGDGYGDGKTEIIHLWNHNGRLQIMWYTPALGFQAHSYGTSQGTGAVAWLTGDIDGSGQVSVVQLWNHNGRLQIMWHSAVVNKKSYTIEFSSNSQLPQVVGVSSRIMSLDPTSATTFGALAENSEIELDDIEEY